VSTYLLLLEFNVCGQCTVSDTVDNFTLSLMLGDLCDFLQKKLLEAKMCFQCWQTSHKLLEFLYWAAHLSVKYLTSDIF